MTFSQTVFINARKAGFRTFLAFWLTSALFVAPLLSRHQNFAHFHPKGTPFHTHAINGLLANEGAISQEASVNFIVLFSLSFQTVSSIYTPLVRTGFFTRAPPLL